MIAGIVKETFPGERRVAVIPDHLPALKKKGVEVIVETGAGSEAGFPDNMYEAKGAAINKNRAEVIGKANVILQIRNAGANPDKFESDLSYFMKDQACIAFLEPVGEPEQLKKLADTGITAFSMELMPRITRAQSMDALSSNAMVAGYKAVLVAANILPRMFPLSMTAAGTVAAARVFVVGAGVAGLQAIATAKRLGAIVKAYDVRPTVRDEVQSLGGKFIELELDTRDSQDTGGYAKEMKEETLKKQREMMMQVVAESDVVITTAAVPGKKAPVLITNEMVQGMKPGSVVVDLAAERGGNCELTKPDEVVDAGGVQIIGTTNMMSYIPFHSSQMYSKNITTFLLHLVSDGKLHLDMEDHITSDTLVAHGGEVIRPWIQKTPEENTLPSDESKTERKEELWKA